MSPVTILIVEDNTTNLKLVSDLLEFEGYRILRAGDAEAALEVVARTPPDLILMDIALPGMDGLTLTRKLKAAEETRHIPVVALSAFAMKGDEEKALAAGCAGYITKPIDTRKLPGQVAAFLAPLATRTQRELTKVLMVDDNETDRKLLSAMLQAEGLETQEAADGVEALAWLERHTVDAIISDIMMPRLDGFSLCHALRRSERWRDLPFIAYTATFTSAADEKLALKAGVDGYLHKPAPLKAILGALHDATRRTMNPRPTTAESIQNTVLMRHYSEHLVSKLEEQNAELSQRTAELEREVVERSRAEREARDNLTLADRSRHTLLGVVEDQKQAEVALQKSEEKFRTMANSISQLAWIARADGFIFWYNQRWYDYTGTTPEQMEGWGWQSVHDASVLPEVMKRWPAAIAAGRPFEMEFPLRGTDGRFRTFLTRALPLRDATGQIMQWFGTNTDVDELKRAEDEVRRLNAELEQRVVDRTAQLAAANHELEAFSYSVSHDLRAPLRAVNGFAGIVLEDFGPQLPAEGRKYLERIRDGGARMGELIDDLLELARLGRQPVRRQTVNTAELVKGVIEELEPQREGRRIEIRLGDLPPAYGDTALLRQVWVNLLSNAFKYSRGRTPAIVEIGCRTEEGETVYFVRDNGAGFDMQYAAKLFGVFQRLHRADEFEGTGVGLAIVQRIVQRHGGRVWAEAAVDRGATFYFALNGGKNHE